MNTWLKEGLTEIGLAVKEYKALSVEEKREVDKLLREMGHLEG